MGMPVLPVQFFIVPQRHLFLERLYGRDLIEPVVFAELRRGCTLNEPVKNQRLHHGWITDGATELA